MSNRRLGALAVAVVAGALCAATVPALSCGWNGCGYGYGYQTYYVQPVYYAQPVYYYAQPVYVQPVYYQQPVYVQPVYYQQPVYAQPTYYSPCCKGPSLWDSLFSNWNCCAQAAYQPVAAPAYAPAGYDPYGYGGGYGGGYIDDGSMYAGAAIDPGYRYAAVSPMRSYDPYLARPPRYGWPRYRRGHVVYRPGYRPYPGYRTRVIVSPRYRPYRPSYRRHPVYVR